MEQPTYESISTQSAGYKIVPHTKSDAGNRHVYLNSYAKSILKTVKFLLCLIMG